MNKKIIIGILIVIAIIGLAIYTGRSISKKEDEKQTNATEQTPSNKPSVTPSVTPKTSTPVATATPTAPSSVTPTPANNEIVLKSSEEIAQMNESQKQEYALSLAKQKWEKRSSSENISFVCDSIIDTGKYLISARDSSTLALAWYEVDVNTNTCDEV